MKGAKVLDLVSYVNIYKIALAMLMALNSLKLKAPFRKKCHHHY